MTAGDTDEAATLLAMNAMVSWLVRRELGRAPEAADALARHTVLELRDATRRDPMLAGAARAAQGVVARAAEARPALALALAR